MNKRMLGLGIVGGLAIALAAPIGTAAAGQATSDAQGHGEVARVVAAHDAAIKACDAEAAAAVYAEDAKLFTAGGVVVTGRAAILTVYTGFLAPHADGGLCGLRSKTVDTFRSGDTIFVESKVTAPFLAQPYFSTDAFVIKGGHIASEVSTFDASELVFT